MYTFQYPKISFSNVVRICFSLSSLQKYSFVVFVVGISITVLIFLIFYFVLDPGILFVFNLIFQSQFTKYYILQFDFYSFNFYLFFVIL